MFQLSLTKMMTCSELFPTAIRNVAISAVSICSRAGVALSPQLFDLVSYRQIIKSRKGFFSKIFYFYSIRSLLVIISNVPQVTNFQLFFNNILDLIYQTPFPGRHKTYSSLHCCRYSVHDRSRRFPAECPRDQKQNARKPSAAEKRAAILSQEED